MKYGTIRNQTQDMIMSELKKHERLRYGELANTIVNEKEICSDRIFRETLNHMVKNNFVKKHEVNKANVMYTIDSKFETISKKDIDELIETIQDLIKDNEIQTILESGASNQDKADAITPLLIHYVLLETQFLMLAQVFGVGSFKKQVSEITKLKKEIFSLLNKDGSQQFSEVGSYVYFNIFKENMRNLPINLIEDFAKGINDFMKKKKGDKN